MEELRKELAQMGITTEYANSDVFIDNAPSHNEGISHKQ